MPYQVKGMKVRNMANGFKEAAEGFGTVLNGLVNFFDNILGNIGKLLSTGIIIFCAILIWKAFWGQIDNARTASLDEIKKMTSEQMIAYYSERRSAYRDAITSVSGPLATICGVVPVVIGIGMAVKKWGEMKNGNTQQPVMPGTVNPMIPQPGNMVMNPMTGQADLVQTTYVQNVPNGAVVEQIKYD